MTTLAVQVPDAVLQQSGKSPEAFARDMLVTAVLKWYEEGQVSQGYAAMTLGVSRSELLDILSQNRISIWQITPDELAEELANAP